MAEPQNPNPNTTNADEEPPKRKFESAIELAKQKAQQIALRLVTDSESKRPRLGSDSDNNTINSSFSTSTPPSTYPGITIFSLFFKMYLYGYIRVWIFYFF